MYKLPTNLLIIFLLSIPFKAIEASPIQIPETYFYLDVQLNNEECTATSLNKKKLVGQNSSISNKKETSSVKFNLIKHAIALNNYLYDSKTLNTSDSGTEFNIVDKKVHKSLVKYFRPKKTVKSKKSISKDFNNREDSLIK